MRYTLKDYQQDAVRDILDNLAEAREMFHNPKLRRTSQFALTATTGAGKTVMAAAVIEALFYGHDEFGFEPDESAVVLWFSDDPNLNEQTRFRLLAASDELTHSDLRVIAHPFSEEKLSPGKVYFLNTDKLTRTSRLTRGHDAGDEDNQIPDLRASVRPDLQGFTIWDTLRNTIEDPNLTLYMVLDEAHRGFGTKASADKPTIVRRLVNGHGDVPPVPVVWGISATVDRFEQAMKAAEVAESRRGLDRVQVDPARVHASGLLKDTIVLDIPAETGVFDTVLLTRATRKIKDSTSAWAEYAATHADQTGDGTKTDPVVPLMVLQVPNTPDPDMVARALDVVFDEWPELGGDEVAHVLGDHTTQAYGPYAVRYISPERVQDDTTVRVLIAKDGISTGWDCPRAEVLMSFRPAKDATHITQLLGRLVRTPLAMRIEGNEVLNSVECILPFFDRKTATQVVQILTGELDGFPDPTGRRVLIRPETMTPNPDVPEAVWDALVELPSQSLPRKGAKPVKRLTALAHALAVDGLKPDAGAAAHQEMHAVLNGAAARHKDKLDTAVAEIWTVHGEEVAGRYGQTGVSLDRFTEVADDRAIRDAFRQAGRVFSPDLAGTYVDALAGPDDDQDDDGLRDAYVTVAALALIPEVGDDLDREAAKLTTKWFDEYRVAIKDLTPERQAVYNDIRAMAVDPQRMDLTRPKNALVETSYPPKSADEEPIPMPSRSQHLLADAQGQYPVGTLNDLELEVLDKELSRPGVTAWYRNPSRSAQDSLGIAYKDARGTWKTMRPDFVFFDQAGLDQTVRASIVDPHGHHLSDALVKLHGLAAFAAEYGDEFHRIEAVAKVGVATRVLDMKSEVVRTAVFNASDAQTLYVSHVAGTY